MFKIIASVDDDRQIFRREDLGESMGELGATDTACESDDVHFIFQYP
jgi:hypothetical protein